MQNDVNTKCLCPDSLTEDIDWPPQVVHRDTVLLVDGDILLVVVTYVECRYIGLTVHIGYGGLGDAPVDPGLELDISFLLEFEEASQRAADGVGLFGCEIIYINLCD